MAGLRTQAEALRGRPMPRFADMPALRVLLTACVVLAAAAPARTQTTSAPASESVATQEPPAPAAAPDQPEIRPRFELYVPSLHKVVSAARESNAGVLLAPLGRMLFEMGSASAEGVDVESVAALLNQTGNWPDVAIQAVTYAPDTEGRTRWGVRFDWPLEDLHARAEQLLESESGAGLFEGMRLTARPGEGYEIALPESTVGFLLAANAGSSLLVSHRELEVPADVFGGPPPDEGQPPPLLACRLNLTGTEKDSGALLGASFSFVTDVDYSVRVNDGGDWLESINVNWPPISGMGAKLMLGKVSRTFFVPREAFGGAAFSSMMVPATLDGLVGFGQQVVVGSAGEVSVIGEATPGPLARHADEQACLALLPGSGFLPMPDIVLQTKARDVEGLVENVRAAMAQANQLMREREQPEPWHESTVRDRTVFWSDGTSRYPGALMPLVMRPVIFATREVDARDRERDYLVIAWTSTGPEDFVRRWLDLPRGDDKLYLPQKRRTHGQIWLNWRQVYRWLVPYVNLALSAVVRDTLMPSAADVAANMTDGWVTVKATYSGLRVAHRGPLPTGAIVVPTMVALSLAEDESAGSDLARERAACRRLRVLYHHSKLFRKDMGRWPAELVELQGYVDFQGHPELLELKLSPRKQWSEWFEGIFGGSKQPEDQSEDDEALDLDTKLYVIRWGAESWSLGFAPDTFDHLADLHIDQDGKIHRTQASPSRGPGKDRENAR
jgi:hypothetical protein